MLKAAVLVAYLVTLAQPNALVGVVICLSPGSAEPHLEAHHAACPQGEQEGTSRPFGGRGRLLFRAGESPCMDTPLEQHAFLRVAAGSVHCPAAACVPRGALRTPKVEGSNRSSGMHSPGPDPPVAPQTLLQSTVLLI
jgi:hypothetical protein